LGTTTVIFGGGTVIVDESFMPQLLVLVDRHKIAIATYVELC
jgi:hypothetical protein